MFTASAKEEEESRDRNKTLQGEVGCSFRYGEQERPHWEDGIWVETWKEGDTEPTGSPGEDRFPHLLKFRKTFVVWNADTC